MTLPYSRYLELLGGLLRPQFVKQDPSLLFSSEKDYAYCSRRFSAEGAKFLTVVLPELRKAVDLSFKEGRLEIPRSFKSCPDKSIPMFLSSHFERIYNIDGSLKAVPDLRAIQHVRQVCKSSINSSYLIVRLSKPLL